MANILKCIILNQNYYFLFKIHWGPTDKKSALVQIMTWQWSGDKPVPSPMLPMLYDAIYDFGLMSQYGDIDLSQHCLR